MDLADLIHSESETKVRKIVNSKGLPIDSRWLDYKALNTALKRGQKDIARFLLRKNCRVNKITNSAIPTNTPLHNAVLLGDEELVQELLKKRALILAVNESGNTPLHLAFIFKQKETTDLLLVYLQKSTNYSNLKNNQGLSLMHIACTTNHSKVIQNFIASGVNYQESVNNDSIVWAGFTALHFAVSFKSYENVAMLLKAGASPDTKDANGKTPLELVNDDLINSAVIIDALSTKKEEWSDENLTYKDVSYFHMACLKQDTILLKKFIEKGVDINIPISDESGFFPECRGLHLAVEANQKENVKLLLAHGADEYHSGMKSRTPLHQALYNENPNEKSAIVDLLHEAVIRNNDHLEEYEDSNGLGYFHVAITRNRLDFVTEILDDDQDVNWPLAEDTRNFPAYYPLHFAVRYQHLDMAALLILRGAAIDSMSGHGTPLHIAFELGHELLIKFLWSKGADVKLVRPKDKKTMLHLLVECYVKRKQNEDDDGKADALLKYIGKLVEKGVDVNAKTEIINYSGSDTALHFASQQFHNGSSCIKLLLHYGADINLRNANDRLPFKTIFCHYFGLFSCWNQYRGNAADFMMFYHHVEKLKALGFEVDPENEKCCIELMKIREIYDSNAEEFKDETVKRIEEQRLQEILTLERVKLTRYTSLHSFLLLDEKSVIPYAYNKILKKIVNSKDLDKNYPSYGYLILVQYRKAVFGATRTEDIVKRTINTAENSSKRQRVD